jgi:hypothetical protein
MKSSLFLRRPFCKYGLHLCPFFSGGKYTNTNPQRGQYVHNKTVRGGVSRAGSASRGTEGQRPLTPPSMTCRTVRCSPTSTTGIDRDDKSLPNPITNWASVAPPVAALLMTNGRSPCSRSTACPSAVARFRAGRLAAPRSKSTFTIRRPEVPKVGRIRRRNEEFPDTTKMESW